MTFALNVGITALLIGFAAWLAGRFPYSAGFVASLPLSTMILLPLVQRQHQSVATTVSVAKAICIALPVTLIFFVPFFLAKRLGLSFWQAYSLGAFGLVPAFFLHRLILKLL